MIYTNSDGGSRGNPGEASIGILIRKDEKILTTYSEYIGKTTNNVAEYKALIKAMEIALNYGKEIVCILDSELVVKQLLGEYQVKDKKLIPLFLKIQELQEKFNSVEYHHVKREDLYQKIVDSLVNEELDKRIVNNKKVIKPDYTL